MAVAAVAGLTLRPSGATPAGVASPNPPPPPSPVSVVSPLPTSRGGAPSSGSAFAGIPVVDGSRSVLRRPRVGTVANWAAGDDCAALADAGFTARCGTAGALVWVVQSRPLGRGPGFEAQVLRRVGADQVEVVLEAVDRTGVEFGDVRTTVTDVAGSDSRCRRVRPLLHDA